MDLYLAPMSSSLVLHAACLEAELPHTIRWVDRATKRLHDGRDYLAIAPKGAVPALGLPDGTLLTETTAVLQYVGDRAPERGLVPPAGTLDRYRLAEALNFVSTELHAKHLAPIFRRGVPDDARARARETIAQPLDLANAMVTGREVLVGDRFTVADLYLTWVLYVLPHGGVALDRWPALGEYAARHRKRPSVAKALSIEGPLYLREQESAAGSR